MRKAYLLDTSVLVHDPAALFRFGKQDIYLPLAVLKGLDDARHGNAEQARNALQAARFLDERLMGSDPAQLERGIPLGEGLGRLYFLTAQNPQDETDSVLHAARRLAGSASDLQIIVVARDINLRIQANALGLHAEDHESDSPVDDPDLLPRGMHELAENETPEQALAHYDCQANEFLIDSAQQLGFRVSQSDNAGLAAVPVTDYGPHGEAVWGIHARNLQQTLAFNLLMDPQVDLVVLLGAAGTGKTLLTLAAGLAQTLDNARYQEILMTRATVAIGDDIGYLPGTEEEKMTPWMGALLDNLEILGAQDAEKSRWGQAASQELLKSRIRVRSLSFMRGRTLLNRYMVLDEAQNLTPQQMRTLITRAGPGTKIVCLGNLRQIDTPWLTPTTSGLTYLLHRFQHWPHAGHLTLSRGERSRLAAYASEVL
ncbi:AAA family ATPase [Spiribacter sp. C176]|uniref:AAA family ATPase n=1 Tax=Spiribacter salilacus TaxID=2664894 RepID=A0A6N7QR55_9GAMM|nr:PhoH family protein [Spiribacter salilacus]MRH77893.1 AAA family ATPase [Spiribacter salilacus]